MLGTSLLVAVALAAPGPAQDTLSPAARRVLADVRYLAADAREGRGIGTRGLVDAGDYVARAFRRARLDPARGGSFFQPFTIAADAPAAMHSRLAGAETRNVVAVLPGRDPARRGEVVVVGAHYDHLGLGGFGALDPDSTGRVHNGADDNASGVAAVLEIARLLGRRRPARSVVFIAFSGEELGDLGSSYYVKHPLVEPIDSVYAMVNFDMVGRLRNDRLLALGAASAREFPALLDSLNAAAGHFDLRASGDGWGPSDHASFFAAKRPVLHFFTDLHEDYHRTSDDWEKINATGLARVAEFASEVVWALAERTGGLTFVDAPPPLASTGGQGYGAYLGTIPDMSESPGGVRITGVRAGSPAEQAGLQGGDIITAIGAKTVANLFDMTDALRSHQAGDTVVIVARRGDAELRLTAVLGKRT
jgi:acetylornithine deacetylase/succinyl-diaminopimelate desuccinylase-like protein